MSRVLDVLFPFWRAVLDIRLTYRGALWIVLLWHVFGWGILYVLLRMWLT